MSLAILISHFDKARESGHGKFVARCSALDDRSLSLAIKECDDEPGTGRHEY